MYIPTRIKFAKRAVERDADGGFRPLIEGNESVEELREAVLVVATRCPLGMYGHRCPFQMLSGLGRDSLGTLVSRLTRCACLELFDEERKVRSVALQG